ncbi:MAG: elongation factor Ts [Deltaproteobacteria bacterium]|nr:elongation factor Ts [Deltaproteobacteria bacterium]MBF0527229.1 elongation factor Ts [Deltaproteobacteria bacterium]
MSISAALVKELRDKTNAPMMDCKKALIESDGDMNKAMDYLRQKGLATARKRAGRATSEGQIISYIEADGKLGVLLELNCETDFSANTDAFKGLGYSLAQQVAAADAGSADLLSQPYVNDRNITVQDLVNETVAKVGESISIGRTARFQVGEKAPEGQIISYIHAGGKLGVMVELNCASPGTCTNDAFKELGKNLAMQIAAANPGFVCRDEVTSEMLDRERAIYLAQAIDSGKPEKVAEKMVDGKMKKFYSEVCLLEQPYIKDGDVSIQDLVKQQAAKLGDNITVARFARFQVGETVA